LENSLGGWFRHHHQGKEAKERELATNKKEEEGAGCIRSPKKGQ